MIRSTINGQIIKGEVYTKIDVDKIKIRFIKVGDLNFIPKIGEKITYGIHADGCNINIYEDIEIRIAASVPFHNLPYREIEEYKNVTPYRTIENHDTDIDEIQYQGEMIDLFFKIPIIKDTFDTKHLLKAEVNKAYSNINPNHEYHEDYIHLWKDPNNAISDEFHQHITSESLECTNIYCKQCKPQNQYKSWKQ